MKITRIHIFNVIVLTGLALVVFAMLAPDMLESREESRAWMAYSDVRSLQDKFVGEALREPTELEERDPWGNAYVLQAVDDSRVRVTSAGPNGVFDSTAAGSDDIWSDMPTSPLEPFHTQRRWELARAFAIGSITWNALMAAYWWNERSIAKRRPSTATDSNAK